MMKEASKTKRQSVTKPEVHLAEYGSQRWADGYVLQHASKHGWEVKHEGWGDFTLIMEDGTSVYFARADGSTGERAAIEEGWYFHGRSHVLTISDEAWAKLVAVFGGPWKGEGTT